MEFPLGFEWWGGKVGEIWYRILKCATRTPVGLWSQKHCEREGWKCLNNNKEKKEENWEHLKCLNFIFLQPATQKIFFFIVIYLNFSYKFSFDCVCREKISFDSEMSEKRSREKWKILICSRGKFWFLLFHNKFTKTCVNEMKFTNKKMSFESDSIVFSRNGF